MRKARDKVCDPYTPHSVNVCDALGKKPRRAEKDDLLKPTELMKQRDAPPELEKNIGKTVVVQNTSERGSGVPGFYRETCDRTYKDSNAYLDHINGRVRESSLVISQSNRPSLTIDRLTRSGPNDKDKGSTTSNGTVTHL
jgi:hypothetical protein